MAIHTRYASIAAVSLVLATLACRVGLTADLTRDTPTPGPLPTLTSTPLTSPGTVSTSTPELTVQDIATRSAQRMAKLRSFHYAVQVSGTPVQVGPLISSPVPITLKHIEGDIVPPDRLQVEITVSTFGIATSIGLVRVGGATYLNNPLTGSWERLPEETGAAFDPSLLFNPELGLPGLLPMLGMETVGFDEIQGELAYHLRASDVEGIDMTGFGGRKTATIDAWVGMQTFLLHQATITETAAESNKSTVWWLSLSAFDRPVTIAPPAR